jgi:hypothetical protein
MLLRCEAGTKCCLGKALEAEEVEEVEEEEEEGSR